VIAKNTILGADSEPACDFIHIELANDKLYSPQMVVTVNTTKYTIENDLTKKKRKKGKTNIHTNKWDILN